MNTPIARRSVLPLLGAAALLPFGAIAQQSTRLPIVGLLGAGTPKSHGAWIAACVERLRELGWNDNRNIRFEYRWGEGRPERLAEVASEFAQMQADVIVSSALPPVRALMKATSTIPIVFAALRDPVADGLVTSLARPGGNVTGLSNQSNEIGAKRLQLLRDLVPGLRNAAVLFNAADVSARADMTELPASARSFGFELFPLEIRRTEDVVPAIQSLKGRADAVYVVIDPLITVTQSQLNAAALEARLPIMHGIRDYAASGGLVSYGVSFPDLFRRAGEYVDRILKGAKAGDLAIQQPTKFELVINLKTAKALGLTVSPLVLAQADEVIE